MIKNIVDRAKIRFELAKVVGAPALVSPQKYASAVGVADSVLGKSKPSEGDVWDLYLSLCYIIPDGDIANDWESILRDVGCIGDDVIDGTRTCMQAKIQSGQWLDARGILYSNIQSAAHANSISIIRSRLERQCQGVALILFLIILSLGIHNVMPMILDGYSPANVRWGQLLGMVFLTGMVGGMIGRLHSLNGEGLGKLYWVDLADRANIRIKMMVEYLVGGVFALIFYFIVVSRIVSFSFLEFGSNGDFKPQNMTSFSVLFVSAFVSGYFNSIVPAVLSRIFGRLRDGK